MNVNKYTNNSLNVMVSLISVVKFEFMNPFPFVCGRAPVWCAFTFYAMGRVAPWMEALPSQHFECVK